MKRILIYIPLLFALFITACSSSDDPKPVDPKAEKITLLTSGTWSTESVIHSTDGDLTSQYAEFSITFTNNPSTSADGDFVAVNGGVAFPDSHGKWTLNDDMNKITLTNGQELAVESLTDQSLKVKVVVAPGAGRIRGLSGEFTFLLEH